MVLSLGLLSGLSETASRRRIRQLHSSHDAVGCNGSALIGAQPTRNSIWGNSLPPKTFSRTAVRASAISSGSVTGQLDNPGLWRSAAPGWWLLPCAIVPARHPRQCPKRLRRRSRRPGSNLRAAPAPCRRTPEPAPATRHPAAGCCAQARPPSTRACHSTPPAHADTPHRRRAGARPCLQGLSAATASQPAAASPRNNPTQALIRVGLGPALESPPPLAGQEIRHVVRPDPQRTHDRAR